MLRLYLDTTVLITAFEKDDSGLQALLLEGGNAGMEFCTSDLTLAEVLVLPLREKNDRRIEFYRGFFEGDDVVSILPLDQAVLYYAAVLRANYRWLKLPDGIHLSTALGAECTHFLSHDRHLEKISTITHSRWGFSKHAKMPAFVDPRGIAISNLLTRGF